MQPTLPFWAAALWLALPLAASAQIACTSDHQPAPTALLERFTSADCDTCWADGHSPQPAAGAVVLDWIVPGARGDDAPLSAVARRDGLERLQALGQGPAVAPISPIPSQTLDHTPVPPTGQPLLRVARGPALGGYIGTSIALLDAPAPSRPLTAWLVLVETIPAGTDGTPVERNLVRNSLVLDWSRSAPPEIRPLSIPEGSQPGRLRAIGWIEDAQAQTVAIAQSVCPPADD